VTLKTQKDVLAVLEEFGGRYPHWRFGQIVSNVAGWVDADARDISDECLLEAADGHLRRRFDGGEAARGPARADLIRVLSEVRSRHPDWRLGQLLEHLVECAQTNIYDIEDEQLLNAARRHLAGSVG
jgi:hypothetical protein